MAITCVTVGIVLLDGSAAHGWLAWLGVALFSTGVALFDGLSERRMGPRQAGMVLLLLGLAGTSWAILVIFLTVAFLEAGVPPILFAALVLSLLSLTGGVALRRGDGRWLVPALIGTRGGRRVTSVRRRAA